MQKKFSEALVELSEASEGNGGGQKQELMPDFYLTDASRELSEDGDQPKR